MKNFLKILLVQAVCMMAYSSCKKLDAPMVNNNGNEVVLTSSSTTLTPTVADSNNVVVSFAWTNPNYATDSANYKFILEIDSVGRNFSKAATREIMGGNSVSLTGRELNAILLDYGFVLGTPYDLEARIVSSYANNNERYLSNTVNLSVTPFNDPSLLTSTVSSVTLSLPNADVDAGTFNWTSSFTGYTGDVTYTIQYDLAGAGFAAPFDIAVGVGLLTKTLKQSEMNESAINSGIVAGTTGTVEYRVMAVTAQGAVSYSNTVNIEIESYVSLLRFYMPGGYQAATGNGNDWDPPTAPEFIRDLRTGLLNNMYYLYIYLPAGAEFKITQGRSWDINYGGSGGTLSSGGANLSVPTAGFYRISINRNTMQYDIREGRMGFVGGATGAGWDPPGVFPNYALGNAGTNLFVGLTDLTSDGWKLIDNNAWNNGSNAVDETRSYGTTAPSGSTLQINGDNFANVAAAGRYRVIWDGRDRDNVKYEMSPATEMRIVGDGMTGIPAWTPGASPQMTYSGNGIWTITIGLEANLDFKFLAGNDWGAFDYEDNSGQSQATGVAKSIKWEGGSNFKTPATAGTYTITLNENLQTVTIN